MRRVLSKLRYLLVWPLITAYRRRARRSLRWRLAGSYLLTLFVSLAAALIFIGFLAALGAAVNDRASEEPADDARAAARVLAGLNLVPATLDAAAPSEVTNALAGMASGDIVIYRKPDQTRFDVRPSAQFTHVRSISIVDASGSVWASSEAGLSGADLAGDAQRAAVLGAASSGSTNLQHNSKLGSFDGGIAGIGAYPLERPAGAVVFVEKAAIASPTGAALWRAELRASAATFGITAFILFIPGLAVATLFAVRSARTIADPLESLNAAAGALAAGDLTRRVRTTGEDEVATLANSFDAMADRLSEAMDDLAAQRARAEALLDQNRQLVANVSHELRTPVAIIRGHLEALAEETRRRDAAPAAAGGVDPAGAAHRRPLSRGERQCRAAPAGDSVHRRGGDPPGSGGATRRRGTPGSGRDRRHRSAERASAVHGRRRAPGAGAAEPGAQRAAAHARRRAGTCPG